MQLCEIIIYHRVLDWAEEGRLKKFQTSSELNIIEISLLMGRLTDHSPLLEKGTATESHSHKRLDVHFILAIYSIRGYAPVDW